MWFSWPFRSLAVLCAVAVAIGGLHLVQPTPSERVEQGAAAVSAAQKFADAATAAFTESAVGSDLTVSPEQRRTGLPTDPVTGLTSQTAAGPVQIVLPGGLGRAEHTPGGQVVYPNAGAGFDLLAENTATGTRTVARIAGPGGPRMVTTFVRTPADTVMLAHTNGYLTINKATPTAETVGMFAPAETRDATGGPVPSSYLVKQLAPQLYVLAEVIDPRPDTAWPVYVDPPLHLTGAGGAPLGLLDSFADSVSSLANTATSAVKTAASATVSGAKAVGSFVKENPLESAMLVGGVALAVTGVGGPAGAAAIAAATVNLSSAGLDIAAAAMPDNQALGMAANVMAAASMVTPQGAAKKVIKEGVEQAGEQLAKHTDDVIDVAKTTPTPPAQLADEVAAASTAKPPVSPGVSPKAPNAPPAKAPEPTQPASSAGPPGASTPGVRPGNLPRSQRVPPATKAQRDAAYEASAARNGGKPQCVYCGSSDGPFHIDHVVPRAKGGTNAPSNHAPACATTCNLAKSDKRPEDFLKELDARGVTRSDADQKFLDKAIQTQQQRLTSPADQRASQKARVQAVTNRQRKSARESAQRSSAQHDGRSGSDGGARSSDRKNDKDKKKDGKSKKHHPKPKGK
ncbi:HNH endonuclease [Mycolicibacterium smegmatis]|uniref:HNH endonuclease n=1 Tax=Mycolicibacterium smegmatis TaxID=1772 RepID=UPI0005D92DCB|nr:HNH endonuclease signature motif containing protein [Mycolicibacterium smegmatis]MCC3337300.1 HNH endonuclease [Mycolicibacterium smegmatis]MCO4193814.1 HNH endonuclease [Mycolicibacterium smegmatis]MCP2625934.1 HNH endonuclease [Mycolicibacterium smegmatis]MDF1903415.1 HNH endonuclease [Mycolicibacterium smegmatis]MDF1909914.1 HNH endonuclease [Mycolicibacterium smegmatis]